MTDEKDRPPDPRPFEQMQRMLSGHIVAQCLHVAATLGIADHIDAGRATLDELARATDTHGPTLHRLLRTLASVGVFTEQPGNRFALTPLGETLRSEAPDSLRDMARFMLSPPVWQSWGSLPDCLKDGDAAFPELFDVSIYRYLAGHAELGAVFNRFMSAQSRLHNAAVVEAYDFSGFRALVGVGGGHGATLAAILARYPDMKGVVFDLPEVVATAPLPPAELAGRCEFVGGSMFESVPADGDAYIVKRVLMDRTDSEAVKVLENCAAAMKPGGNILVIDPMLPAPNTPHPNWLIDMHMLVVHGSACRTETQFRSLFAAAGLKLSRIIATRSPNFILEGVRR